MDRQDQSQTSHLNGAHLPAISLGLSHSASSYAQRDNMFAYCNREPWCMQPAYTCTQKPTVLEVLWPARSTACPRKLGYVDNKQVGEKKKKKRVNKQCVGPSQQSELKQGSTSNKRSQTKLAGAALQASTVAEALSLYYPEPHTLLCKPGSKWLQQV